MFEGMVHDAERLLTLALEATDDPDGSVVRAHEVRTMLGVLGAAAPARDTHLLLEPIDLREAIDHALALAAPVVRDRMVVIDAGDRAIPVMATDTLATLAVFLLLVDTVPATGRRTVEISVYRRDIELEIAVRMLGPSPVRQDAGHLPLLATAANLLGGSVVGGAGRVRLRLPAI